ncbi:MAG: hypothetical protein Q7K43_01455, partial [Candidatus Woesearchaeota archaeon]|nr:hypothetical protein [Candidatus Woesearchaeota archaeon]
PRSLTAQSMVPEEPYKTNRDFLMLLWNYSLHKNIVSLKEIRKASEGCVLEYLDQKAVAQRAKLFVLGLPVIFGANLIGYYVAWRTGYQANADLIGWTVSFSAFAALVPFLRKLNAQADSARNDLRSNVLHLADEEWR